MKVVRTFIQISALMLTLEAAFFLAKGNLGLSAEVIADLSSANWDYNLGVVRSLTRQQADTWVGFVLLLLAFGFQMWNAIWEMRIGDFDVHKGAAVYAIVFSLVVGFGAYYLSSELATTKEAQIKQSLEKRGKPAK